jgi:hypothetical protein
VPRIEERRELAALARRRRSSGRADELRGRLDLFEEAYRRF